MSTRIVFGYPDRKKIYGNRFVLCHFPMLTWHKHFTGAIHLHGHCHGSLTNENYYNRKVMDVGIDTHPEFRPYNIDEILKMMENRMETKRDGKHDEK